MIRLGMHADNWRTLSGGYMAALDSAAKYKLDHMEFGMIDGQYFIPGNGYEPSLALRQNPLEIRRLCEARGLKVSQIDASYPMMGFDGAVYGVQYVQQSITFCPRIGLSQGGHH